MLNWFSCFSVWFQGSEQHSFYELIVNKARGKSGPLFHFDVHEDVRTIADATINREG
ncbi:putative XAP5 protein [Rosa chinensis]|uniref:Putative XAP5 protein n=1 Tax=Rosa chinensis TaxID=74649 RepID=A0A2P6QDR7_ROSCH|nr:putative XAP5 protein [Rosa chinensis]